MLYNVQLHQKYVKWMSTVHFSETFTFTDRKESWVWGQLFFYKNESVAVLTRLYNKLLPVVLYNLQCTDQNPLQVGCYVCQCNENLFISDYHVVTPCSKLPCSSATCNKI